MQSAGEVHERTVYNMICSNYDLFTQSLRNYVRAVMMMHYVQCRWELVAGVSVLYQIQLA